MAAHTLSEWTPWKAPRWEVALTQFLDGAFYAKDLGQDRSAFAVDIGSLRSVGLTTNDIRWLEAKGYVTRGLESTDNNIQHEHRGDTVKRVRHSDRACFVLTETGIAFAARTCRSALFHPQTIRPSEPRLQGRRSLLPRWDQATRTLWLGSHLIKRFKLPAANQELVLAAFNEESWIHCIDDPLPPTTGVNSKRRLHDTIIRLNRSQNRALIRFHGNGNGRAIHWERVPSAHQSRTRPSPKRR